MFASFFYLLRARGLKVSLTEWLALVAALDQGLFRASFTQFYYLCRSVLVKSEADFDKFDGAFLEFFQDLEPECEQIPEKLLAALNGDGHFGRPGERPPTGRLPLEHEEIEQLLVERLEEQKNLHQGGKYAIGVGGASPFGTDGSAPNGIRVGGKSRKRRAMRVAGERKYRDFRDDSVLGVRDFQLAFRRLRQFSGRLDTPRSELDLEGTIKATCDNGGKLKLVFERPRKNTVKLLLLMDSGGSMEVYSPLCAALFQAVSKSNHFKDLKVFYFHNCFKEKLYKTPRVDYLEAVDTERVLRDLGPEYRVIIVGDGLMDLHELTGLHYQQQKIMPSGLEWLQRFKERYPRLVWLSPVENEELIDSYWGESYRNIQKEVELRKLSLENLGAAIKKLLVAR